MAIRLIVDASDVDRLARRVHNLGDLLSKRAVPVSFGRAMRAAKTVAANEVIRAGGFHRAKQKPGLATEVRGKFRVRIGQLEGSISARDRFHNLAAWTAGGVRDNYRGRGVHVLGAYYKNTRFFDPRKAFIRQGQNGNRLVLKRIGARGMQGMSGPNPAMILRSEAVLDKTRSRFFQAFDSSVNRYLDQALARL